ncbi:MAG: C40 family peptidase [Verrucomicrobia bacterium]|nr:C40 family peptidase [Verrucomicrobiota bacterium]
MNRLPIISIISLASILTIAVKRDGAAAPPSSEPEHEQALPQQVETSSTVTPRTSPLDPVKHDPKTAEVSTLAAEELADFDSYPPALQDLVRQALKLTTKNLRYQYGSADPANGGMDCSGTIYYLLKNNGFKNVPRQSDDICRWVMRDSVLNLTEGKSSLKDNAFSLLRPGCLLFWTGTTDTATNRELPVTHVMLYLGKRKSDAKPIVFGSSDGRSFEDQRRNGVSVFDFQLPLAGGRSAFYGYGPIPGLPFTEKAK